MKEKLKVAGLIVLWLLGCASGLLFTDTLTEILSIGLITTLLVTFLSFLLPPEEEKKLFPFMTDEEIGDILFSSSDEQLGENYKSERGF